MLEHGQHTEGLAKPQVREDGRRTPDLASSTDKTTLGEKELHSLLTEKLKTATDAIDKQLEEDPKADVSSFKGSDTASASKRVSSKDSDGGESFISEIDLYDAFDVDDEFLKDIGSLSKYKVLEKAIEKLNALDLGAEKSITKEVQAEVARLREKLRERRLKFVDRVKKQRARIEQVT